MMNVPCTMGFQNFTTTSFTGALSVCLRCSASRYTWLSCRLSRTYRPTPTISSEAMNGMRQAHSTSASGPNQALTPKKAPLASSSPSGAPSCGKVPNQARLPSGAFSVATRAAPPHSPPRPSPCPIRNTHSRMGAQMPMLW